MTGRKCAAPGVSQAELPEGEYIAYSPPGQASEDSLAPAPHSFNWFISPAGMVVNGFVNVVITTIERRFGLRSSETGLVAGGYDIASFLCLVPVTYFGGYCFPSSPRVNKTLPLSRKSLLFSSSSGGRRDASKPKWIGYGILFMALGSFVFALPHFMVPAYRGVQKSIDVCQTNSTLKVPQARSMFARR